MSVAAQMLESYPKELGSIDRQKLQECIEACFECAQACTACADACLSEDVVAELTTCIRTNLDDCGTSVTRRGALSRHTGDDANLTRAVLEACAAAGTACGEECDRHAGMHEHCRCVAGPGTPPPHAPPPGWGPLSRPRILVSP